MSWAGGRCGAGGCGGVRGSAEERALRPYMMNVLVPAAVAAAVRGQRAPVHPCIRAGAAVCPACSLRRVPSVAPGNVNLCAECSQLPALPTIASSAHYFVVIYFSFLQGLVPAFSAGHLCLVTFDLVLTCTCFLNRTGCLDSPDSFFLEKMVRSGYQYS